VGIDGVLAERETEPTAHPRRRVGPRFELRERSEDFTSLFLGDALAGVRDAKRRPVAPFRRADHDVGAARSVPDGVLDQVREQATQQILVGERVTFAYRASQLDTVLARRCGQLRKDAVEERAQVDPRPLRRKSPFFRLRDVQQIDDHPGQSSRLVADLVHAGASPSGHAGVALEELCLQRDRVHRRLQIVNDEGDEAFLLQLEPQELIALVAEQPHLLG
jgi:hypothetical protein